MTNEEARALYARAVAAGFRLEPGCRVTRTRYMHAATPLLTVVRAWANGPTMVVSEDDSVCVVPTGGVWCDFREAPSLGCLLKQVRAEWCHPTLHLAADWNNAQCVWRMVAMEDGRGPDGLRITARTEAETLVAALEAAPMAWDVRP